MQTPEDKNIKDSEIYIFTKAKMKSIFAEEISEIKVDQLSNVEHIEYHEKTRENVPDDLENGKRYDNATIISIRGNSIEDNV